MKTNVKNVCKNTADKRKIEDVTCNHVSKKMKIKIQNQNSKGPSWHTSNFIDGCVTSKRKNISGSRHSHQ